MLLVHLRSNISKVEPGKGAAWGVSWLRSSATADSRQGQRRCLCHCTPDKFPLKANFDTRGCLFDPRYIQLSCVTIANRTEECSSESLAHGGEQWSCSLLRQYPTAQS